MTPENELEFFDKIFEERCCESKTWNYLFKTETFLFFFYNKSFSISTVLLTIINVGQYQRSEVTFSAQNLKTKTQVGVSVNYIKLLKRVTIHFKTLQVVTYRKYRKVTRTKRDCTDLIISNDNNGSFSSWWFHYLFFFRYARNACLFYWHGVSKWLFQLICQ